MTVLSTPRLRLEPFAEHHLDGLHAMNSRPEVMRYISGQPETREQTAAGIARVQRCWAAWGTSWWALIELGSGRVAGAGCIQHLRHEPALPADLEPLRRNPLEIGWRLHPDFWRQGLASEAAARMAAFAFEDLGAAELLAVRHPDNSSSARVMDRLGMRYRALESWYGTMLATHVLGRGEWLRRSGHATPGNPMSDGFDPEGFAQRQLEAYNARHLERFLAEYTDDVAAYRLPGGEVVAEGKAAFGEHYRKNRFTLPGLHAELVKRMVFGNKVIDQERVHGVSERPLDVAAIYEVTPGGIRRVWFLSGE